MKRNSFYGVSVLALLLVSMLGSFSVVAEVNALRIERAEGGEPGELRVTWEADPGAEYELQWSLDLEAWESVEGYPQVATSNPGEHVFNSQEARMFFRLVSMGVPASDEFVLIPAGNFEMGDHFAEGMTSERPVHDVHVSGYFIARSPVSRDDWQYVYAWAIENGYQFDNPGAGKAGDHPVQSINWHDAIKWCNARSEMEELEPVYFSDDARVQVYRSGKYDVSNQQVAWNANGYRLPTEAEWEKAARGGLEGRRFPWGDTINHNLANYWADFPPSDFDESYSAGFHPDYNEGAIPYTNPLEAFAPNAYGLYDMAGNVWQWCWDRFDDSYYSESPLHDPRGPVSGNERIVRGGSWVIGAWNCRVSDRFFSLPNDRSNSWGFRLARSTSGD